MKFSSGRQAQRARWPDTDDDDGCAEQGEGAGGVPNHKPEQAGTRNKELRRHSEARNLSQQRREEHKTGMTIIRQIEEMEYEEQAAKAGAWSTRLEGRVGHGSRCQYLYYCTSKAK